MKKLLLLIFLSSAIPAHPEPGTASGGSMIALQSFNEKLLEGIRRHLGRPYVWGSSGMRSFDCSGFVWRVMQENGIHVKRTSARKFYYRLPKVSEADPLQFGTIVFFNKLKHVGIVNDSRSFYHASVKSGTTLSEFDPFWRSRIVGFRAIPLPRKKFADLAGRPRA